MSTFPGLFTHLPNISVDRFDGDNLKSTCFFLSHCHSDHMQGLKSEQFYEHLEQKDYNLYCSRISKLILSKDIKNLNLNDRVKEIGDTMTIYVGENEENTGYHVTVTVIPAGHCPGSVMFLFETSQDRILYTGDFRLAKDDVKLFKQLHDGNNVKNITQLYFDSTFFNTNYFRFPSRKESVDKIIEIIENQRSNKNFNVNLDIPYQCGFEFIFIRLAHYFKCKIHVCEDIYERYCSVPEIICILTNKCSSTFLHVLCHKDTNWLQIKPSAMWCQINEDCLKEDTPSQQNGNFVRVCYSSHCSYEELVNFLSYLKPRDLVPCVVSHIFPVEIKDQVLEQIVNMWRDEIQDKDEVRKMMKKRKCGRTLESEHLVRIKVPIEQDSVLDQPPPKNYLF